MWELNCEQRPQFTSANVQLNAESKKQARQNIHLPFYFFLNDQLYKDRLPTKCADECLVARKSSSANADVKITRELLVELKRAESQIET